MVNSSTMSIIPRVDFIHFVQEIIAYNMLLIIMHWFSKRED